MSKFVNVLSGANVKRETLIEYFITSPKTKEAYTASSLNEAEILYLELQSKYKRALITKVTTEIITIKAMETIRK